MHFKGSRVLVEVGGSGDDALYFQIEGDTVLDVKKLGGIILGEVSKNYKNYVSTSDDYCLVTDGNHEAEEEIPSKGKKGGFAMLQKMKSVVIGAKNNFF